MSLKKEISLTSELFKKESFDTIFFGGGTPSLLSHQQIYDVLNHIHKNFHINNPEVSLESNPEDFFEKNLYNYKSAGINRVSFGVQSFIDSELKFLTRQHTAIEAEDVIRKASEYFENINLDIIYSLPSQTINDIHYSLSKAKELNVKHISAYTLTFEEKTLLYKSLENNTVTKNSEFIESEFYNYISNELISNGYEHYEVSNFAKAGYECRHNLKYWNYDNYVSFGPSAHSFFNNERWNNYNNIIKYNNSLKENKLPIDQKYKLSDDQKKLEFIMLSLRSHGVDYKKYKNIFDRNFDEEFLDSINILIKNNFAVNGNERFKLNEKGFALADEIIAKYF